MSAMTEEEKKLFRLYGKLPAHKNVLSKVQKDRKYFDSGDYALSKAGVTPQALVGTAIPHPENIPHVTPSPHASPFSTSPTGQLGSPIKEPVPGPGPVSPSSLTQVPIIPPSSTATTTTEPAQTPIPASPLASSS